MKNPLAKIMAPLSPVERRVWSCDTLRQGVDGLYTSLVEAVFLLIAIQLFEVSDFLKGTIGAAGALGMFLAFFLPAFIKKFSIPVDKVIGALTLLTGCMIILAGFATSGSMYTAFVVAGIASFSLRIPLFAQLYSDVYHGQRRAKLFNYGRILLMVVALVASFMWGNLLELSLSFRWIIYLFCGGAMVINSFWLFSLERGVVVREDPPKEGDAPLQGKKEFLYPFSLIWKDPVFGVVLGLWFLIGFANLWTLPLRVSYVSDPKAGLGLSPQYVLLIMGIIPLIVKLTFSWVWAHLFDKINFVFMRILINLFMGFGIFIFFITESPLIVLMGSVVYSIAASGAPIIWNLWVTRLAPAGKTRDYMVVHTGMTGIRGLIGPYLGFWVASGFSVQTVGAISLGLALLSSLGFLSLIKNPRITPEK